MDLCHHISESWYVQHVTLIGAYIHHITFFIDHYFIFFIDIFHFFIHSFSLHSCLHFLRFVPRLFLISTLPLFTQFSVVTSEFIHLFISQLHNFLSSMTFFSPSFLPSTSFPNHSFIPSLIPPAGIIIHPSLLYSVIPSLIYFSIPFYVFSFVSLLSSTHVGKVFHSLKWFKKYMGTIQKNLPMCVCVWRVCRHNNFC